MAIHTHRTPRFTGFTLIELLVVISIIALLISILLPALRMARESARMMTCSSNMRQYALSSALYQNDHDGLGLPYKSTKRVGSVAEPYFFQYVPHEYFNGNYEVGVCPSDEFLEVLGVVRNLYGDPVRGAPNTIGVSYMFSDDLPRYNLYGDPPNATNGRNLSPRLIEELPQPSSSSIFLETAIYGLYAWNSNPLTFRFSHGNGSLMNVAYVDGHAAPADVETVVPPSTTYTTWLPGWRTFRFGFENLNRPLRK